MRPGGADSPGEPAAIRIERRQPIAEKLGRILGGLALSLSFTGSCLHCNQTVAAAGDEANVTDLTMAGHDCRLQRLPPVECRADPWSSLRRQVAKQASVSRQTNMVKAFILLNATFVAWRAPVTDYRVYVMNPQNRIVRAVELFCASDQEAQAQVRRMTGEAPLELWQRARFLGRYDKSDALGATPRPDPKS